MPPIQDLPDQDSESDSAPLVDLTESLPSRSKRTKRQLKKKLRKTRPQPKLDGSSGFLSLPYELLSAILELLRPSDIFVLTRVCKPLRSFILEAEARIARAAIELRYPILGQCLPPPVLLTNVAPPMQALLQSSCRPDIQHSHKPLHQNIPRPDRTAACTCLTCVGRWNALCAVVDFAHWQDDLDDGKELPQIPRGQSPTWNEQLLARNARIVTRAMTRPLWYARVLEAHLKSTTRSVLRHSQNKGDKRRHFQLTAKDLRAGTDVFLQNRGPCEVVYPFSRDNYYMLEAFLPGRCWVTERQKWIYVSNGHEWHQADLDMLARLAPPGPPPKQDAQLRVTLHGESQGCHGSTQLAKVTEVELMEAAGHVLAH